jgi:hypothetical protein
LSRPSAARRATHDSLGVSDWTLPTAVRRGAAPDAREVNERPQQLQRRLGALERLDGLLQQFGAPLARMSTGRG